MLVLPPQRETQDKIRITCRRGLQQRKLCPISMKSRWAHFGFAKIGHSFASTFCRDCAPYGETAVCLTSKGQAGGKNVFYFIIIKTRILPECGVNDRLFIILADMSPVLFQILLMIFFCFIEF